MDKTPKDIWQDCLLFIKNNIDEHQFNTWFTPIQYYSYDIKQGLKLSVPNSFLIEHIETHFLKILRSAILKNFGKVNLHYVIGNDKNDGLQTEVAISDRSTANEDAADNAIKLSNNPNFAKDTYLDPHLNTNYTFDNFVEGVSNKLPRTVALAIAEEKYQNTFNPFFIFGASGVGKSHLVNAIGTRMKELHPEKRVLYVSAHLFQVQYTDSILNNKFNDFISFYQSIDTLIVDDIQEISGKTKTQEAFFNIFNHLHLNQRQIIMTCDRPPVSLEGMTERLLSRFKWGMIAELEQPDSRLRKDILNYRIQRDGLQFPQNVINYIANNVTGSVRNLEGTINSMMAYSIVYNSEINMDLAEKVVSRVVNTERKPLTIDSIIDKVCKHYSIKDKEVMSASRKHELVQARQISMYLSQKYTNMSSTQIGARIGKRDHSTVLHSCDLVEKRLNVDKSFRAELERIERALL